MTVGWTFCSIRDGHLDHGIDAVDVEDVGAEEKEKAAVATEFAEGCTQLLEAAGEQRAAAGRRDGGGLAHPEQRRNREKNPPAGRDPEGEVDRGDRAGEAETCGSLTAREQRTKRPPLPT